MRTLYVHIGHGKTGTTALQRFCALNRRELARRGLTYLRTGRQGIAHHALTVAFGWTAYAWIDRKVPPETLLRRFTQELRMLRGDALISSETLSGMQDAEIETLARAVPEGVRIRVLYYVRRQDRHAESAFNQAMKGRNSARFASFEAYFEQRSGGGLFDYLGTAERWARIVGRENVIVRRYERSLLVGGDVSTDLCDAVGVDPAGLRAVPMAKGNPSLTPAGLDFRIAGRARTIPNAGHFYLVAEAILPEGRKLVTEGSAPRFLSASERQALLANHADGNAELARRFLGIEDGVLFPGAEADVAEPDPVEALSRQELAELSVGIWAELWPALQRRTRQLWIAMGVAVVAGPGGAGGG
ncbi:MAG: hypothetical protein AAFW69_11545, partial [Pseudomonadota bacterium]